jgi:hypothetical protein
MAYEDQDRDIVRSELLDWRDFSKTQRKIIARRQMNRRFLPQEAMAMKAAHDMLLDGKISIITKIEPASFGPGPIVTYIAERVK